jgi:diketogulonate reductase-like aldo/keto reductase
MQGESSGGKYKTGEYGVDFPLNNGINIPSSKMFFILFYFFNKVQSWFFNFGGNSHHWIYFFSLLVGFGTRNCEPNQVKPLISKAIELGYRFFDCYSECKIHSFTFNLKKSLKLSLILVGNQEEIGQVFSDYIHTRGYGRPAFFISSKLPPNLVERHQIHDNLETILHQLQCHHLDLWLLQPPTQQNLNVEDTIRQTWKVMETLQKDGKTRCLGVSNFTLDQLRKLVEYAEVPPSVLVLELHPYNQPNDLIEFCNKNGIHIVCACPLGSDQGCQHLLSDNQVS